MSRKWITKDWQPVTHRGKNFLLKEEKDNPAYVVIQDGARLLSFKKAALCGIRPYVPQAYPKTYYHPPTGETCTVESLEDAMTRGIDANWCESPAEYGIETAPAAPYDPLRAYTEAQYWWRKQSQDDRLWASWPHDRLLKSQEYTAAILMLLAVLYDDVEQGAYDNGTIPPVRYIYGTFTDWLERQRAGFTGEHTLYLAYTKVLGASCELPWIKGAYAGSEMP